MRSKADETLVIVETILIVDLQEGTKIFSLLRDKRLSLLIQNLFMIANPS